MAGENEASVARRPVYSGACPACVNGSGTAHVRAYTGTDENVVVVKGKRGKLGEGVEGERGRRGGKGGAGQDTQDTKEAGIKWA